ncbi:hypothetical protein A2U01_0034894, partial [Trifolium medium]|nr:hypothetical protein [Trifolium medium]
MENWDLWQASEYLLMKQGYFICIFQLNKLVAMTMNAFITFLQPTKHRGIFAIVEVYFTLVINGPTYAISFLVDITGFQSSNLNQLPFNVLFAFQFAYIFKKLRLDFGEVIEYELTYIVTYFDLEDKIIFRGVGNDRIYVVWIQCLMTKMFCNERTSGDIKVAIVVKLGNSIHKKISWLWYCGLAYLSKGVESMYVTMGLYGYGCYGYDSQRRMREDKQWDPGGHVNMCPKVISSSFK